MSEQEAVAPTEECPESAKPQVTDGIEVTLSVAVIPGESVAANYRVVPTQKDQALRSLSVSFALEKDGLLLDSVAGTSLQMVNAQTGDGVTGDAGCDLGAFPKDRSGASPAVVLSGFYTVGEEPQNFMVKKTFEIP